MDCDTGKGDNADRRRRLPLLACAIVAVLVAISLAGWFGFAKDLDVYAELRTHREALLSWRDQHFLVSMALFVLLYLVVVVLSLPVNFAMTILGGFLFGFLFGTVLASVAVTAGAVLVFAVARASFGAELRRRVLANGSSRLFAQMDRGFARNALWYLLVLRLVPTVPSLVSNAAPAFFGVRTRTFAVATLIGVVPSSIATAWIGASLSNALAEDEVGAFAAGPYLTGLAVLTLVLLAALPALLRRRA